MNILTNLAFHKREISVFGGSQFRPNIHIDDMCRAYLKIITAPVEKIAGQVFNVGSKNQSVLEIAEIVKSVVGGDVKLVRLQPTILVRIISHRKKFMRQSDLNLKSL